MLSRFSVQNVFFLLSSFPPRLSNGNDPSKIALQPTNRRNTQQRLWGCCILLIPFYIPRLYALKSFMLIHIFRIQIFFTALNIWTLTFLAGLTWTLETK